MVAAALPHALPSRKSKAALALAYLSVQQPTENVKNLAE
jgi:hypothetical protein